MTVTLADDPSGLQDQAISVLSFASSVLLLGIICGAVYLTLNQWKYQRETNKEEDFAASTGTLPVKDAPLKPADEKSEEGNRYFRRMNKSKK
ncbi:unnamed protein product [Discosporangium mesarthrocarpum]